jgi:hypothetical protein
MRGPPGQWKVESNAGAFLRKLARILGAPERPAGFHCSIVEGEFIHAGTTCSFRKLAARSGGILDGVVGGACKAGREALTLECDLSGPVFAGRGAILHGLTGLSGPEFPKT